MTKPSDFILNSDYLALAENNKQTFNILVPSMSYTQNQGFDAPTSWHTDLTTDTAEVGSIDEFYVTVNNKTFFGDTISSLSVYPGPPGVFDDAHWFMEVDRINRTKIRVSFVFVPELWSQGATINAVAMMINLVSFKPPNVF